MPDKRSTFFIEVGEGIRVSSMPPYWMIDELSSSFDTIISLATPFEHSLHGYDPRSLNPNVRFYWFTIPEFNAPKLSTLASLITRVAETVREGKRVLVHSKRACGRLNLFLAAWLLYSKNTEPWIRAIVEAAETTGCHIETRPQLGVLKSYARALRTVDKNKVLEILKKLRSKGDEKIEAVIEYAFLLLYELGGYLGLSYTMDSLDLFEPLIESNRELDGSVRRGVEQLIALSESLYDTFRYTIADIEAHYTSGYLEAILHTWIPREVHPSYYVVRRKTRNVERRVFEGFEKSGVKIVLKEYSPSMIPFL